MADFNQETKSIAQAILNDEYMTGQSLVNDMRLAAKACGVAYVKVVNAVTKLTCVAE